MSEIAEWCWCNLLKPVMKGSTWLKVKWRLIRAQSREIEGNCRRIKLPPDKCKRELRLVASTDTNTNNSLSVLHKLAMTMDRPYLKLLSVTMKIGHHSFHLKK